MEQKYFFFDIDGTLRTRDDYTIPASAFLAIQKLKETGHHLYIATGRGLYSARNMGRILGIDNVISDGGRVVFENGKIVYQNPMSVQDIHEIESLGVPVGYSNEFAIHSKSDVFSKAFDLDETILCSVKKQLNPEHLGPLFKMYIWQDREVLEKALIIQKLEHHWLREKLCVVEHRHKDEGIRFIMKKHGLKAGDCICFGDDINDMTMFDLCGFSVCMGNGSDEAKTHAKYIASDIHEDGLYRACLKHGWIE